MNGIYYNSLFTNNLYIYLQFIQLQYQLILLCNIVIFVIINDWNDIITIFAKQNETQNPWILHLLFDLYLWIQCTVFL